MGLEENSAALAAAGARSHTVMGHLHGEISACSLQCVPAFPSAAAAGIMEIVLDHKFLMGLAGCPKVGILDTQVLGDPRLAQDLGTPTQYTRTFGPPWTPPIRPKTWVAYWDPTQYTQYAHDPIRHAANLAGMPLFLAAPSLDAPASVTVTAETRVQDLKKFAAQFRTPQTREPSYGLNPGNQTGGDYFNRNTVSKRNRDWKGTVFERNWGRFKPYGLNPGNREARN
eukprot:gene12701-biopygen1382